MNLLNIIEHIKTFNHTTARAQLTTFWLISLLLISSWCYIFLDFFPNQNGNIGHDYSYFLPRLLAGNYWFNINGYFSIPYFTPAFCAGDLFYANPQNTYYSLPQLLTFFIDPLSAVSITFVLFAIIGYFGFYYLLRETFRLNQWAALLGASLFLFNNFYAYRIIIGHLSFHGFMLIPFVTFFLLKNETNKSWISSNHSYSLIPALLLAYIVYSGGAVILLPIGITILAIILIYASIHGLNRLHWKRLLTTFLISLIFSASKLSTIFYVVQNFPRDRYPLPGVESFLTSLWIPFKSLFIAAENNSDLFSNLIWELDRHAFEFGITFIPLIILSLWVILLLTGKLKSHQKTHFKKPYIILLAILVSTPILLNFYTPEWNAFLKKIPIINSSTSLTRWYMIYIPVLLILTGFAFNSLNQNKKHTQIAAIFFIALIIAINITTDKEFYHSQRYNPQIVIDDHRVINKIGIPSKIDNVGFGFYRPEDPTNVIRGNEIFTSGISKLDCYQPLFGYNHEFFPQKESLEPGSVWQLDKGHYNMKNPACYIYPDSNQCKPGDNFIESQKNDLEKFVFYIPYNYALPLQQIFADILSITSIFISIFFLLTYNLRKILIKNSANTNKIT